MESLSGRWRLVYVDNAGEYCDAIGTQPVHKEQAIKLLSPDNNVTQDISFSGGSVTIISSMPGTSKEMKAKLGETVKAKFLDGRDQDIVFRIDGDKLVEQQSGAFISTNVRHADGQTMIMEMTAENGVKSTRKYNRVL